MWVGALGRACGSTSSVQPPPMLKSLILITALFASASATAEEHSSIRILLTSTATGAPLLSSSVPPWRFLFGDRVANVSGFVMQPSLSDDMCTNPPPEWRGQIILAGDWTTPRCSPETRARALESVGAVAAVIEGTEGLPFGWDGSDRDTIRLPTFTLSYKLYGQLKEALSLAEADRPTLAPSAHLWLVPEDTPLLQSRAFTIFDRCLQAAFFFFVLTNILLAIWRLHGFWRVRKLPGISISAAVTVLTLELIGCCWMLVFIVDGPSMEHTRPALMPFMIDRLSLSLSLEFNMLSMLVMSMHLRQIRKRVEHRVDKANKSNKPQTATIHAMLAKVASKLSPAAIQPEDPMATIEAGLRPTRATRNKKSGRTAKYTSTLGGILIRRRSSTGRRSSVDKLSTAMPTCTLTKHDHMFAGMVVLLIIVENTLAVLTGLFMAPADVTFYATIYIILVLLVMGFYFMWQATIISRALERATTQYGDRQEGRKSPARRFTLAARRIGVCLIVKVILGLVNEFLRLHLMPDGGWTYWGTLTPISSAVIGCQILASGLAINAFRPPDMGRRQPSRSSLSMQPATTQTAGSPATKRGWSLTNYAGRQAIVRCATDTLSSSFMASACTESPSGSRSTEPARDVNRDSKRSSRLASDNESHVGDAP